MSPARRACHLGRSGRTVHNSRCAVQRDFFGFPALIRLASKEERMARVSTYLNFPRSTEAAFVFYKAVFGSEFAAPIISSASSIPGSIDG